MTTEQSTGVSNPPERSNQVLLAKRPESGAQ